MYDFNSPGMEPKWQMTIINKMLECRQHEFLILSKKPEDYRYFTFPSDNIWLGTTVTNNEDAHRIKDLIESTHTYSFGSNYLFISFEPLLNRIVIPEELESIDWIIIGALSRVGKPPLQPDMIWVQEILEFADEHGIPVYMKDNLTRMLLRKGFPEKMNHTFKEGQMVDYHNDDCKCSSCQKHRLAKR